MGPLPQHSAMEMRRYMNCFLPLLPDLSVMSHVLRTRFDQYEAIRFGGLRSEGRQNDILRRDGDRACHAVAFVVERAGRDAAGRRREAKCRRRTRQSERSRRVGAAPATIGFDDRRLRQETRQCMHWRRNLEEVLRQMRFERQFDAIMASSVESPPTCPT